MAIFANKQNETSSFYESFSDLLFCTLVLFLVIVVALIVRVDEETQKISRKEKFLAQKVEEADKKIKGAEEEKERLDIANLKLQKEKGRLEAWNSELTGQATNIQNAIDKATVDLNKVIKDTQEAHEQEKFILSLIHI